MGVDLRDIVTAKTIEISELRNKLIAIDAFNAIYQFLSALRQSDGTSLKDSHDNITSHLSGLFYRTIRQMKFGIKPIYVFDGKPVDLKFKTLEKRSSAKEAAKEKWSKAIDEGNLEDARKFAKRTSTLTGEMVGESKNLLTAMGIPCVQAVNDGEALCAHICKKGDVYAVATQDYDALLFGAPKTLRNLTFTGDRELEMLNLADVLKNLGISREQLIDIGILVGTDFNDGVKGVGPKTALKIVKSGKFPTEKFNFDVEDIRKIFTSPNVSDEYNIEFKDYNEDEIFKILCDEHDFSRERVKNGMDELRKVKEESMQKGLNAWF
ncbi:MAG: flap endonuclease-1 [Candidatus Altiarchaeales archaeon HGW-Altiarchaeales-1]|nr:MAG: flap endonuclease-1 [Candidatus Altiarchaeales archaeon HGW-Altiarchaeales-1]